MLSFYKSFLEYIEKLKDVLEFPASVNLYVFHGGSTFGFLNGANNDDTKDSYHPDVSSYGKLLSISESTCSTEAKLHIGSLKKFLCSQ